ncbi:MAG TPA: ATP-grasp domain-containing protein [Ideonella sp.]|nr:ATP-grasp domain-containing protein [Ideonella sp.]
MTVLAVAAMSARMMAEAAVRDGFEVIALDLFGDVDTCEAASRWFSIGSGSELRIDPALTLAALRVLAHRGGVSGWVAGGGFEGLPELVAQGAAVLPLIGTQPAAIAAVRDPVRFFTFLAALDIAHPRVQMRVPADPAGWLIKDANGCGGWQVHRAPPQGTQEAPPQHCYYQREQRGQAMSATFVANGSDAVVLGFNEQIVNAFGQRPFVFCGVIGPVPLPPAAAGQVQRAVSALTAEFALRGVCSLDFLLDGDGIAVLEVNPRPPASMALYGELAPMAAHLRACQQGELPAAPSAAVPPRVQGSEVVFAQGPLVLGQDAVMHLAAWPGVHDLPCAGGRFGPGDPVCSVSASGSDAAQVRALLSRSRTALLRSLET